MPSKKTVEVKCACCTSPFSVSASEVKRGRGRYCSRQCATKHRMEPLRNVHKKPNFVCAYCGKHFYSSPRRTKKSKSRLYFCCRKHKDLAARIDGGIKAIQPDFYCTNYRTLAFSIYPHKCNACGYDKYMRLLSVHHIDGDHFNSVSENLEILCVRCHMEKHLILGTDPE